MITSRTTLEDLAFIVSDSLKKAGLSAVLSGGGVVVIYTGNRYQSQDLDFVTSTSLRELEGVMAGLGFHREGRNFRHPSTVFTVEFPPGPVSLGSVLATDRHELQKEGKTLRLLSPTECVMDRLIGYYSWKDVQNLQQAIWVCLEYVVDLKRVKAWSDVEGFAEEFETFLAALAQARLNEAP